MPYQKSNSFGNRDVPAFGFGRSNKGLDHSKLLQRSVVTFHDDGEFVGVRAAGRVSETGKAVTGASTAGAGKSVTGVAATDLFTSAAHGFQIGDEVKFTALTGGAGITQTTQSYYVIASGLTTDDFRVSLTPGGATIDFTTDISSGTVSRWSTLFTVASHGYLVGDEVRFTALTGGAGLTPGVSYWISPIGFTTGAFRVTTLPNGLILNDITSALTAGTVSRQRYTYLGAHNITGGLFPGIPGPRQF